MKTLKTLPMLVVAMLLGAAANAPAAAAEGAGIATITVTAKRAHAVAATAEMAPPKAAVEIVTPMPTDMPEMEIDSHLTPIEVVSAQAAARVSL